MTDEKIFRNFAKERQFPYISFALGISLGVLLLTGVAEALISIQIPEDHRKQLMPWIIGGCQIIFMLLPVLFAARHLPLNFAEVLRLNKVPDLNLYLVGFAGLVAVQIFLPGWQSLQTNITPDFLLPYYNSLEKAFENIYLDLLGGSTLGHLIRALIIGAFLPAVCEEFLFRGFLQRSLEERMPPMRAILLTSLIFSLSHFNPINLISLFVIGFYFGLLAYSTRSLILPIILHLLNNVFAIITMYLPQAEKLNDARVAIHPVIAALMAAFGLLTIFLSAKYIYSHPSQIPKNTPYNYEI